MTSPIWIRRLPALAIAFASAGCSLLASSEIEGTGLGTICKIGTDCHTGLCEDAICTRECGGASDCPAPMGCFSGRCSYPVSVGAIWSGSLTEDSWSAAHEAGLQKAGASRPFAAIQTSKSVHRGAVSPIFDGLVEGGVQLIVGDSPTQIGQMRKKADDYPSVLVLAYGDTSTNGRNFSTFQLRTEDGWYVAGTVAARHATKRLGAVAGQPSPESVRQLNAFYLGARSVNPAIVLEVRWIGYSVDYSSGPSFLDKGTKRYYEEFLAAQLLEGGSEVVANMGHNQRVVKLVESRAQAGNTAALSISNISPEGCKGPSGELLHSCLGGVVFQWDSFYGRLLDQVHRRSWIATPVNLALTAGSDSVVTYARNTAVDADAASLQDVVGEVSRLDSERIFTGPYDATGQRDPGNTGATAVAQHVALGETPSTTEIEGMCWFIKGIVEKVDHEDPHSEDRDAFVPDAEHPVSAEAFGPPGSPPGVAQTCRENR